MYTLATMSNMTSEPSCEAYLRKRERRTRQNEIVAVGVTLFRDQGFEFTTVNQIEKAAGLSAGAFYRYFATKADLVAGIPLEVGHNLREELENRPATEPPWEALRQAICTVASNLNVNPPLTRYLAILTFSTSVLRARHLEHQIIWERLLLPNVLDRLGGDHASKTTHARALIFTALSRWDQALRQWALDDGKSIESLDGALFVYSKSATRSPKRSNQNGPRQGDS